MSADKPLQQPTGILQSVIVPVTAGVVIAAIVSGGGAYAYERHLNNDMRNSTQKQIDGLRAQVGTLEGQVSSAALVYTNLAYGFQLTFPSGLSSWKVVDGLSADNLVRAYDVYFPTADPAYADGDGTGPKGYYFVGHILVLTPNEWTGEFEGVSGFIKTSGAGLAGLGVTKLAATSQYVFAYAPALGPGPSDWTIQDDSYLKSVVSSFSLIGD